MNTKQYIDSRLKKIEDILINHLNNCDNAHNLDSEFYSLNLIDENIELDDQNNNTANTIFNEKLLASDLLTDPNHRLLSDSDIDAFKSKVGKMELEAAITDLENNLKIAINSQFDNLLNSKDIMNAIANLREYIQNNEDVYDLIEKLSKIANSDYLNEHIKSSTHITSEDRDNLDQLFKFINIGCADWEAKESDPNYIRNKPESLPANGGDAATVGGYCAGKLINKQPEHRIIGIDGQSMYGLNQVNMLLNDKNVHKLDTFFVPNVSISIREGEYNFKSNYSVYMTEGLTLYGIGVGTIIKNCRFFRVANNIRLNNLKILKSDVYLSYDDFTINDVVFENCKVIIDANRCIIKNCRFINCEIEFKNLYNSIIKDNIVSNSGKFIYLGSNNIFGDNIIL